MFLHDHCGLTLDKVFCTLPKNSCVERFLSGLLRFIERFFWLASKLENHHEHEQQFMYSKWARLPYVKVECQSSYHHTIFFRLLNSFSIVIILFVKKSSQIIQFNQSFEMVLYVVS